jgi:phospholipid transport system substrate-binding protein
MKTIELSQIERRQVLGLAMASLLPAMPARWATAATTDGPSPAVPVERLNEALLASMKAGDRTPFEERARALAPVIEQVFDLGAVLAASIGLSWSAMTPAERAELETAFRRYTVSNYVSNFDSYSGQSFQVLPSTRSLPNGNVVVQTLLLRSNGAPIRLDYVMRPGPAGWQAVDVLTDGAISRVAVQRSDFRGLLMAGGVPALTAGLGRKTANLAGSMSG